MDVTTRNENGIAYVDMTGSFTFADNQNFRALLNELESQEAGEISIDFTNVDFIDSAALGMLLLMRDQAEKKGRHITLVNSHGQIRKMFDLSRFSELFTVQ